MNLDEKILILFKSPEGQSNPSGEMAIVERQSVLQPFSEELFERILNIIRCGKSFVTEACDEVNLHQRVFYAWLSKDRVLRDRLTEAKQIGYEKAREEQLISELEKENKKPTLYSRLGFTAEI